MPTSQELYNARKISRDNAETAPTVKSVNVVTSTQPVNNTQINGATILVGNGVTGTGSQRVTIASDQTPFGVNAIQSGTWNIGTISVLPALPAGSNTIGNVNVNGTLPVSGSVTVSGTVTATGTLTDTQLRATPVPVSVTGGIGIGNVDVVSLPVAFTNDTTAIKTSVELLDNAVNVHHAVASTTGLQASGFASTTTPTAVNNGDSVRIWTTVNGAVNIADGAGSITVDGTFWQTTQPVSLNSLPAFAATPTFNIGTAPNLTITNTAFTANAGTNLNTSALALESGGNLAGINTKLPESLGAKSAANSLSVTQAFAATSTLANVTSSATSVTLLAANNNRKTAIIINDSTSDLYVTLNASAASTTNYSLFLAAKVGNTPSFLAINGDDYSGEIRGIWSSANGFARITEVV